MASVSFSQCPTLKLQTVSYQDLVSGTSQSASALSTLKSALKRDGAVSIGDVPNFVEQRKTYFKEAVSFAQLSEEQKQDVAAGGVEDTYSYLGYDVAAEQFKGPNGEIYADQNKRSYYAIFPDSENNKWQEGTQLKTAFLELARTVHDTSEVVLRAVGILGEDGPITDLEGAEDFGRMLHYITGDNEDPNPFWCGQHKDHSLITGLIQPLYMLGGEEVPPPEGAGLHIKVGETYHRVIGEADSITYQIGDFGQLISNDDVIATEHRVNKPNHPTRGLERHTLALFIDPKLDQKVENSTSVLASTDSRYVEGDTTFNDWHLRTLARHKKKKDKS